MFLMQTLKKATQYTVQKYHIKQIWKSNGNSRQNWDKYILEFDISECINLAVYLQTSHVTTLIKSWLLGLAYTCR